MIGVSSTRYAVAILPIAGSSHRRVEKTVLSPSKVVRFGGLRGCRDLIASTLYESLTPTHGDRQPQRAGLKLLGSNIESLDTEASPAMLYPGLPLAPSTE